jgi:hypothetical protein
MAVDRGTIAFGRDRLGGLEAFLVRNDGSFWYYAHLKSYARGVVTGQRMHVGDLIGRCGASGDATVPHVHFAFFTADRVAVDPIPALVAWLHDAVRRLRSHGPERAQSDVVALLPLPRPDVDPTFVETTTSAVRITGLPWSARDRFLLAVALLSPFGWAAGAVAIRRRRAIAVPKRG